MPDSHRHQNIVAVFLVPLRNNQVLLALRHNTGYKDGWYSLVCGHVEPGESFTQGVIRETQEEAGVILKPDQIQPQHVMHRKSDTDSSERVDVYFVTTNWDGEFINQEPEKCAHFKWFNLDELPDNTVDYVVAALADIQAEVHYSERGWSA